MKAWLFDVDGVITDLETKDVEHPEILERIVEKLKNEPVGIITGRAFPWLLKRVINKIEDISFDKLVLDNLHIEAEFGGISVSYRNGEKQKTTEKELSLPSNLSEQLEFLAENKFNELMFVDHEKITHFTAEMKKGIEMTLFKTAQRELTESLRKMIDTLGLTETVEIHEDAIATNVKNKKLNKHLATEKFLNWLKTKRYEPELFYVFGDSMSDLQIGEELHKQEKKVNFIYTGRDDVGNQPFEISKTKKHYDEGTLEYLR